MTASDGFSDSPASDVSVSVEDPCVSLAFDGTASMAVVADNPSLSIDSNDFTIELLAYFDDTSIEQTLIGSSDGVGPNQQWSLSLG